jgi:hypothetical protein
MPPALHMSRLKLAVLCGEHSVLWAAMRTTSRHSE